MDSSEKTDLKEKLQKNQDREPSLQDLYGPKQTSRHEGLGGLIPTAEDFAGLNPFFNANEIGKKEAPSPGEIKNPETLEKIAAIIDNAEDDPKSLTEKLSDPGDIKTALESLPLVMPRKKGETLSGYNDRLKRTRETLQTKSKE